MKENICLPMLIKMNINNKIDILSEFDINLFFNY